MRIEIGLDAPYALSAEARKEQGKLKSDIAALNAAWTEHAAQADMLHGTADADWTGELHQAAEALGRRRIQFLRDELAIRGRVDAFLAGVIGPEYQAAREATYERLERATADVRRKLLSVGFIDAPNPSGAGYVLDHSIYQHPAVQAAVAEEIALGCTSAEAARQLNAKAIAACRQQLADLKRKATAALV